MNKSAASAASLDYVEFQAVIKSAASAASLHGGRASGRLDHVLGGGARAQKIIIRKYRKHVLVVLFMESKWDEELASCN